VGEGRVVTRTAPPDRPAALRWGDPSTIRRRPGNSFFCPAMTPDELDTFGAIVRTLRGFLKAFRDVEMVVGDVVLPNPDDRAR